MKESIFNHYFIAEDGTKLIFNSRTCALGATDETYKELISKLKDIQRDNVPERLKECFNAAIEGEFIVDDDCEEILEYGTHKFVERYDMSSLALVIAPTMSCNLRCVYCFEGDKKPGMMKENVKNAIVEFVKGQASHLKNLEISWYGGEPLVGHDIIYEMSETFLNICNEHVINYSAFMTTNGVLIDKKTVENLKKFKINKIQFSLDGPPEVHDMRRVSIDGKGTFDTIINNINLLLKDGSFSVFIRVNIDKNNFGSYEKLVSILDKRLISHKVKLTLGHVTARTEACKSVESGCYNAQEFSKLLIKAYSLYEKYGFTEKNKFPYPSIQYNFCKADVLNSFVIDPFGDIYKCWVEIGIKYKSIGNILSPNFEVISTKNLKRTIRRPEDVEACTKCKLLPVCATGCSIRPKNDMCDNVKYILDDIVKHYYEKLNS
jgi:uncharacterized protein